MSYIGKHNTDDHQPKSMHYFNVNLSLLLIADCHSNSKICIDVYGKKAFQPKGINDNFDYVYNPIMSSYRHLPCVLVKWKM